MNSDVLSEQDFEKTADQTLLALERALGDVDGMEADLQSGILTLEFDDGTKYIVNSHRAARQIWMAAERSAWHFDFHTQDGRWVAAKTNDELHATLQAVISRKLGRALSLPHGA